MKLYVDPANAFDCTVVSRISLLKSGLRWHLYGHHRPT